MASELELRRVSEYGYIYNRESKNSLINISPIGLAGNFESIPPSTLDKGLYELEKEIKPNEVMRQVKNRFWKLVDRHVVSGRGFTGDDVILGICGASYFRKEICYNSTHLAWLVLKDQTVEDRLEVLLEAATKRLEEIVSMPLTNKDGKLDVKAVDVFLKLYDRLLNRVKGSEIQRIENKTLSMKVDLNDTRGQDVAKAIDQLKERIGYITPASSN